MPAIRYDRLLPLAASALVLLLGCTPGNAEAPSGEPAGTPAASVEADQAATPEPAVALREVDGGSDYYASFKPSLSGNDAYFPIGVWLESVVDPGNVASDLEIGLNTYVELTEDSNLALLEGTSLQALTGWPDGRSSGAVLADEVDMWAGPGSAAWTGKWPGQGVPCAPEGEPCGYSVQGKLSADVSKGMLRYANYGKGVTFWESNTEARVFVNDFQDVVSADNYWFTDPNICGASEGGVLLGSAEPLSAGTCRSAANYGRTVERLRSLMDAGKAKPVWAFVEVGTPFADSGRTVTPEQVRAAAWSSVIHGARGIVYFNHSFAGACPSYHVLRDCPEIRSAVGELNGQLASLAPVLNAPFADNLVAADGAVDVAAKLHDGDIHIIAASTAHRAQEVEFTVRCSAVNMASVSFEDRSIAIEAGTFRDRFEDGESVHIYRLNGNTCGF